MEMKRFISYLVLFSFVYNNVCATVIAAPPADPTQDSNASSYKSFLDTKVNPRTGQLQASFSPPQLAGFFGKAITPSIAYNQNAVKSGQQMLGLPLGWSYNYSYIYGGYVFVNGQSSYQLDSEYSSGMRYYTLKNMQFRQNALISVNGDVQTFDAGGKLTQIQDRFGNKVSFMYSGPGDVYSSYITGILDSYGQRITFDYQNGIKVTYPRGGQNQVSFSYQIDDNYHLAKYVDPMGYFTQITNRGGIYGNLLSGIAYPNGKNVRVTYGTLPYFTDTSLQNTSEVDSVSSFVESIAASSKTTRYDYNSGGTQNNFTGYGRYPLSVSDSLLESNDPDYFYMTSVDDGLFVTQHRYNHLHLELETKVWTKENYVYTSKPDVSHTFNTYQGQNKDGSFPTLSDLRFKFPNYQTPAQVTVNTYNDQGQKRVYQMKTKFDLYANPTTVETYKSGTPTSTAHLIKSKTTTYDYAHYGLVTQQETSDYSQSATNPIITRSVNTISNDSVTGGKTIGTTKSGFVLNGAFQPSKMNTFVYDSFGRKISQTLAWVDGAPHSSPSSTNKTTTYSHDPAQHTLTVTSADFNGKQTATVIDTTTGWTIFKTNPLGAIVKYAYDNRGRKLQTTDPLGVVTNWTYIISPNLNKVTTHYGNGYETYSYYDGFGRKIKTSDNLVGSERILSQITYDPLTQKVLTQNGILGTNSLITYAYDKRAQLASKTDALGNVTSYVYDPVAQTKTTSFNGVKTTQEMKGDLESTHTAYSAASNDSYSITKTYDGSQKELYKLIGNESSADWVKEISVYDSEHQLIQKTVNGSDGLSVHQDVTRDLFGNATKTTNTLKSNNEIKGTSISHTDVYNELNQLTSETNTLNQQNTYAYDPAGRKITQKDYSGRIFSSNYNANDQILSRTYTDNNGVTHETSFIYDSNTHDLTSIENKLIPENPASHQIISQTYDNEGKLLSKTYPGNRQISYEYDDTKGQLRKLTDALGNVTSYMYDDYGRLSKITHSADDTLTYAYYTREESPANSGMLKSVTYSNGIETSYAYDGYGSIQTITMTDTSKAENAQTLIKEIYTYDPVTRNVISMTYSSTVSPTDPKLNHTKRYTYNTLNQLTQEDVLDFNGAITTTTTYQYDAASNVVKKVITGSQNSTSTYQYDSDNKLTQTTENNVSRNLNYDLNGNLINTNQGFQFAYNELDQLTSYTNGSSTVLYAYYPDGLRASKQTQGRSDTIQFYYDHDENPNIVNEVQGAKSTADMVGVLDASKTFQSTYQHTPYGDSGDALVPTLDIAENPFKYTKEYSDSESGLQYLRARYYNPGIQQFMSRDSYPLLNRYNYTSGNPIMFTDPSGHINWAMVGLDIGLAVLDLALIAAAPVTGGSSLAIGLGVTSGLLGLASTAVDITNQVKYDGNNSDLTYTTLGLGLGAAATGLGGAAADARLASRSANQELEMAEVVSTPGESDSQAFKRAYPELNDTSRWTREQVEALKTVYPELGVGYGLKGGTRVTMGETMNAVRGGFVRLLGPNNYANLYTDTPEWAALRGQPLNRINMESWMGIENRAAREHEVFLRNGTLGDRAAYWLPSEVRRVGGLTLERLFNQNFNTYIGFGLDEIFAPESAAMGPR